MGLVPVSLHPLYFALTRCLVSGWMWHAWKTTLPSLRRHPTHPSKPEQDIALFFIISFVILSVSMSAQPNDLIHLFVASGFLSFRLRGCGQVLRGPRWWELWSLRGVWFQYGLIGMYWLQCRPLIWVYSVVRLAVITTVAIIASSWSFGFSAWCFAVCWGGRPWTGTFLFILYILDCE